MRAVAWKGLLAMFVAVGCVAKHERSPESTAPAGADGAESPASVTVGNPRSDLIPRAVLFGNPERSAAQLSPDGKWVSWLAPREGVLNVWVAPAGDLTKAKPVTAAKKQSVLESEWAFDGKHLLYWQDEAGDENFHVYRVAVETGEVVDLTPIDEVNAGQLWLSHRKPNMILVELNDRDKSMFDVHAIDLATGERRLVARNDQEFSHWPPLSG